MANQEATGRHGHKDTEEPYPHHGGASDSGDQGRQQGGGQQRGDQQSAASNESDLKEREYRDKDGNVHHHTRTYEEQHGSK